MSDPKMFSDGLITPFIDAAQQQDQDRIAEQLSVIEWAQERYENTIRLAAEKTGFDRDGWLEDAAYWRAIVVLIQEHERLKAALTVIVAKWRNAFPVSALKSRDDYYSGQACGTLKCSDKLEAALKPVDPSAEGRKSRP